MQVEIIDSEVKGVVVVMKDESGMSSPWHMRMVTPSMKTVSPDHPYIWYVMTPDGWESVCNKHGPAVEDRIEAAYQEQI